MKENNETNLKKKVENILKKSLKNEKILKKCEKCVRNENRAMVITEKRKENAKFI